MSDGGKGSGRRPGSGYQDSWERIFGRGKTCPPCHGNCNQGRACPARSASTASGVLSLVSADLVQQKHSVPHTPQG